VGLFQEKYGLPEAGEEAEVAVEAAVVGAAGGAAEETENKS
jgi:hypothetical protein